MRRRNNVIPDVRRLVTRRPTKELAPLAVGVGPNISPRRPKVALSTGPDLSTNKTPSGLEFGAPRPSVVMRARPPRLGPDARITDAFVYAKRRRP